LIGDGATQFCREGGLAFAEADYFYTDTRWQALTATIAQERAGRVDDAAPPATGGMTGRLPGRVGDSPIIGAGTFADNATCAVSATGHGEFFIRYAAAHEIAARIAHRGEPLAAAAGAVVAELGRIGGSGGLVAVG